MHQRMTIDAAAAGRATSVAYGPDAIPKRSKRRKRSVQSRTERESVAAGNPPPLWHSVDSKVLEGREDAMEGYGRPSLLAPFGGGPGV